MPHPTLRAPRALPGELLKELRRIVGGNAVLTERGELLPYESDALTIYRGQPAAVVFPADGVELRRAVAALHEHDVPFVPRGAGTGLSGGAVADGAVILELSRLNRIVWIDAENRRARVQPGVVNTQLQEALAPYGLIYAPDPSSQTVSTLGGNVAENSGGPHCLKYGVTTNHILATQVVLPSGELAELQRTGGAGYDLVGLFVGSEGTLGVCSEIEVQLVPRPAAVETLLAHFDAIEAAGGAVSAIIASGVVPSALEMIDRETLKAVEASIYAAGFPTDVAASLIVELDGPAAGLAAQADEVEAWLREHGAREVARAADDEDRARFWKARKSAFGAMGRIAPELLVQDATVPRSRLPEVLRRVDEIGREYDLVITNVFHAGDGNLHPNIPFDRRDAELTKRVHAASAEIMKACVAAGGTITGEHGVGLDKRDYMPLIHSPEDLRAMRWVKQAFDPKGLCNPGKVLPDEPEGSDQQPPATGKRVRDVASTIEVELGPHLLLDAPGDLQVDEAPAHVVAAPESAEQLCELLKLAAASRWTVLPAGEGRWLDVGGPMRRIDLVITTRRLKAPMEHAPEDLLATVGAGRTLAELDQRLRPAGQWWPLDPLGEGTVGATIASASAGPAAAGFGATRDLVLGLTVALADGSVVKAGGRVVKNVAGYDMVKLFTGSWGTLGIVLEANLRLQALPKTDRTRLFSAPRFDDLVALAGRLRGSGELAPVAMELMSDRLAGELDVESDGWSMAVRWMGHPRAVDSAVSAAAQAAGVAGMGLHGREGFWSMLRGVEEKVGAGLSVRIEVPPRSLGELVRAASSFAPGREPLILAAPALGRIWVLLQRAEVRAQAEVRAWALRVSELRRIAGARGGGVRIDRAPLTVRKAADPWGHPEATTPLEGRLRARFDPDSRLKPGFFPEGG